MLLLLTTEAGVHHTHSGKTNKQTNQYLDEEVIQYTTLKCIGTMKTQFWYSIQIPKQKILLSDQYMCL